MIDANTKCKIVAVPDNGGIFAGLLGANATATSVEGARGTGTQAFKLDAGGMIFGNVDSGFKVEAIV